MAIKFPKIEFYAIYNEFTGQVTGVYPDHAAININYKVKIDDEMANMLLTGAVSLNLCYIDLEDKTFTVIKPSASKQSYNNFHRIPDKKYFDLPNPDITITFDSATRYLIFRLSDRIKNNEFMLNNHADLSFLICSYNDPHNIYQIIKFPLVDLLDSSTNIKYEHTDDTFSIFTSKIFKKYIIEKI